MVLVVILGRTGRTEFNFPATIAALVANVALNLLLVPPLGIVGAGLALVASYVVVLALMYVFTQRLFPVPYEWGRLARVVLVSAGAGRRSASWLMPTAGVAGLLGARRCSAPPTRSLSSPAASSPPSERALAGRLRHPRRARSPSLRALRGRAGRASTARSRRPTRPSDGRGPRLSVEPADSKTPAARSSGRPVADRLAARREERLARVGPVDARRAGRG